MAWAICLPSSITTCASSALGNDKEQKAAGLGASNKARGSIRLLGDLWGRKHLPLLSWRSGSRAGPGGLLLLYSGVSEGSYCGCMEDAALSSSTLPLPQAGIPPPPLPYQPGLFCSLISLFSHMCLQV